MHRRFHALAVVFAMLSFRASAARAADETSAPPVRLFVGAEASGSIAARDDGHFNDEDYGTNTLRLVRLRLTAEIRARDHVAALGELRQTSDNQTRIYALYLRVSPWRDGPLDLQLGMVPPVFGAYPRRAYAIDNPLIGQPLGYQYLTALRSESAPRTAAELVDMRGRGWSSSYSAGASSPKAGVPLVVAERWDTGIEARFHKQTIEAAVAVTQGSPCDPRVRDDNGGKTLTARVAFRPTMGLVIGASAARGRYLDRAVEASVGGPSRVQDVWGADLEYSRGRFIWRAEGFRSRWVAPFAVSDPPDLTATAGMLETRVKVVPGLSLAARIDRLSFGDVVAYETSLPWDYGVTRWEAAVDVLPHRHVLAKIGFHRDRRDGGGYSGYVQSQSFVAGQVVVWF